jgi:DNA-binding NtrC family response regulator
MSLDLIDKTVCEIAIAASRGNVSAAAKALGLNRTTLHMRLKRYGINVLEITEPEKDIEKLKIKPPGFAKSDGLSALKCKMCYEALQKNGWNRSKAAKDCGVSVRYIRYMVQTLRFAGYDVPSVDTRGRPI